VGVPDISTDNPVAGKPERPGGRVPLNERKLDEGVIFDNVNVANGLPTVSVCIGGMAGVIRTRGFNTCIVTVSLTEYPYVEFDP
jgi:hypothetical protein